jgi:hypothetical protein
VTAVAVSSNSVAPGTLGFLVVFGMAAVLTVLFRSMTKHLRKVNQAARRDEEAAASGAQASAADAPPAPGTGDAAPASPGKQGRDT